MSSEFVLLNSFDRSGSTLISKALAGHPQVENLFNPFNATIFREEFMKVWAPDVRNDSTLSGEMLVKKVLEGDFDKEVLKSRVFFTHSSTSEIVPGALHIIKTTNFHNKMRWFSNRFADISSLGLIRRPISILASLVRNGFHQDWYGGWAYSQMLADLDEYRISEEAREMLRNCTDSVEQMACIIGCLNNEMLLDLKEEEIIKYEDIIEDPNKELGKVLNKFGLPDFDFESFFSRSVNSLGRQYTGREIYMEVFDEKEIARYSEIFNTIGNLGYLK